MGFGWIWVWLGFFKRDKLPRLGHADCLNNWTVKWWKFYPKFSWGHKCTCCHTSLERAVSAGTTCHTLILLIKLHWQLQPEDFNPDGFLSGQERKIHIVLKFEKLTFTMHRMLSPQVPIKWEIWTWVEGLAVPIRTERVGQVQSWGESPLNLCQAGSDPMCCNSLEKLY